jgi:hypothetical protein
MSAFKLEDFVEIDLGYKTLMNAFFHLDREKIAQFGIEASYLEPVFALSDLDGTRFVQNTDPTKWLFTCDKPVTDLRGTGALRYIRFAQNQETGGKKQAGKTLSTWKDALSKQGGKYWYSPKAAVRRRRIALRKGIDTTYSPYIFERGVSFDQRLYVAAPHSGIDESVLIAYLLSSLFALSLEVNADMGQGDGVLTMGTKALRRLPSVDLGAISRDPVKRKLVVEASAAVLTGAPRDAQQLSADPEIRLLDESFMRALSIDIAVAADVERDVAALARARTGIAQKRKTYKAQTEDVNVGAVVVSFVDRLRPWLEARRFPEDYLFKSDIVENLNFGREQLSVDASIMLDQCHLRISGIGDRVICELDCNVFAAEVVLRTLQLGRREFPLVRESQRAASLLRDLRIFISDFERKYDDVLSESTISYRFIGDVKRRTLKALAVQLGDLNVSFDQAHTWFIDPVAALG